MGAELIYTDTQAWRSKEARSASTLTRIEMNHIFMANTLFHRISRYSDIITQKAAKTTRLLHCAHISRFTFAKCQEQEEL